MQLYTSENYRVSSLDQALAAAETQDEDYYDDELDEYEAELELKQA